MKEFMTDVLISFKRPLKYFVLLLLLLIHFTACQNDKLYIPDTGRKIVINGLITTDSLLNLRISKSAYYNALNSLELLDLDSAGVYFYQDNSCIDSLHLVSHKPYMGNLYYPSNYRSKSIFPVTGKEYKVIVKAPGYPDATSTTVVPDLVQINKLDTSMLLVGPDPYHPYLKNVLFLCNINFSDPGDETNYYMVEVGRNYHLNQIPPPIRFYTQDPIVEEILGNESNEPYAIAFTDKVINGQNYNLKISIYKDDFRTPSIDDEVGINGISDSSDHRNVIYFNLYSITEDYYRYIQTFNLYKKNYGNPLTEPVMIYSNITGGYGIFASAAVSTDSLVFYY
jgi:hypothetical protein